MWIKGLSTDRQQNRNKNSSRRASLFLILIRLDRDRRLQAPTSITVSCKETGAMSCGLLSSWSDRKNCILKLYM